MKIVKVTPEVAVSEQVNLDDVPAIAAAGYAVLMNNRPDGESPGQPTSAEFAAAAAQNGLQYVYYPINGMNFPGPNLSAVAAAFDNAQGPVLAFCRSGTAPLIFGSRAGHRPSCRRPWSLRVAWATTCRWSVSADCDSQVR